MTINPDGRRYSEGVTPSGSGYSAEPEPCSTVSAVPVSIPNADDYTILKAYGHSAAKAAEIVLDAQRGDYFCQHYIAFARNSVGGMIDFAEAIATEARRAETENTGSIHEGAGLKGIARNTP